MPTDTAFDAARLEFKLIDQPITSTASSDLTKPFNEVSPFVIGPPQLHMITCCDASMPLHVLLQEAEVF